MGRCGPRCTRTSPDLVPTWPEVWADPSSYHICADRQRQHQPVLHQMGKLRPREGWAFAGSHKDCDPVCRERVLN